MQSSSAPVVGAEDRPEIIPQLPALDAVEHELQNRYGRHMQFLPHRKDTIFIFVQHGFATVATMMNYVRRLGIPPEHIFMTTKPHTTSRRMLNEFKNHPHGIRYIDFAWDVFRVGNYNESAEITADRLIRAVDHYLYTDKKVYQHNIKNIVVLDEGGRFANRLPPHWRHGENPFNIIIVEHTQQGLWQPYVDDLNDLLICLAKCYGKDRFESKYIGDSMDSERVEMLLTDHQGPCGLIGCGAIGSKVLAKLVSLGRTVICSDSNNEVRESCLTEYGDLIHFVDSNEEVFHQTSLVFGCTGHDLAEGQGLAFIDSVIGEQTATESERRVTLVNCGSGDKEYRSLLRSLPADKQLPLKKPEDITQDIIIDGQNGGQVIIPNTGMPINFDPHKDNCVVPELIQITRAFKYAACAQALELLSLYHLIRLHPEADAWLRGFIVLDLSLQRVAIHAFLDDLKVQHHLSREYRESLRMDMEENLFRPYTSAGVAPPELDYLTGHFLFKEFLRNNHNITHKIQAVVPKLGGTLNRSHRSIAVDEVYCQPTLVKQVIASDMRQTQHLEQQHDVDITALARGFNREQNPKHCRRVVTAPPGFGKTTLTYYLVSHSRLFVNNKGVIRLDMGHINHFTKDERLTEDCLTQFIQQQLKTNEALHPLSRWLTPEQDSQILLQHSRNYYCLLLDGFDRIELSALSDTQEELLRQLLSYPYWVLTSRPEDQLSVALSDYAIDEDVEHYALKTLKEKDFKPYYTALFNIITAGDAAQLSDDFESHMTPEIQSMCQVPLFREIICSLFWADRTLFNKFQVLTEVSLYKLLVQQVVQRELGITSQELGQSHLFKKSKPQDGVLLDELSKNILRLQEIALWAVGSYFTLALDEIDPLLATHLIHPSFEKEGEQYFEFNHQGIREYLAACELLQLLMAGDPEHRATDWFNSFKYELRFRPILQMLVALLYSPSCELAVVHHFPDDLQPLRRQFWLAMFDKNDLLGHHHIYLLMSIIQDVIAMVSDQQDEDLLSICGVVEDFLIANIQAEFLRYHVRSCFKRLTPDLLLRYFNNLNNHLLAELTLKEGEEQVNTMLCIGRVGPAIANESIINELLNLLEQGTIEHQENALIVLRDLRVVISEDMFDTLTKRYLSLDASNNKLIRAFCRYIGDMKEDLLRPHSFNRLGMLLLLNESDLWCIYLCRMLTSHADYFTDSLTIKTLLDRYFNSEGNVQADLLLAITAVTNMGYEGLCLRELNDHLVRVESEQDNEAFDKCLKLIEKIGPSIMTEALQERLRPIIGLTQAYDYDSDQLEGEIESKLSEPEERLQPTVRLKKKLIRKANALLQRTVTKDTRPEPAVPTTDECVAMLQVKGITRAQKNKVVRKGGFSLMEAIMDNESPIKDISLKVDIFARCLALQTKNLLCQRDSNLVVIQVDTGQSVNVLLTGHNSDSLCQQAGEVTGYFGKINPPDRSDLSFFNSDSLSLEEKEDSVPIRLPTASIGEHEAGEG